MALFEYLTGGVLLAPVNITNLILQNSYIVIMALGMLLIIVGGNIDLSVGSIVGFVGAVAATMMVDYKIPWLPVVGLSLVLGGVIGAAQGYFVAYAQDSLVHRHARRHADFSRPDRQHPARPIRRALPAGFPEHQLRLHSGFRQRAAEGRVRQRLLFGPQLPLDLDADRPDRRRPADLTGVRRWRRDSAHTMETEPFALFAGKNAIFAILTIGFSYLLASYRGLPNVLIIMGALILLYMFVTTRMTIGRRIYALGGNRMAAQLSGIRTERLIFLTFANMGALAGLAGLIVAARLNSATPSAGNSFELDVIAACFIGGASASGGVGKVMGVVIGAFVMGVMNNGMSILGIGIYWQYVVKGTGAAGRGLCRRLSEEQGIIGGQVAVLRSSPSTLSFLKLRQKIWLAEP